MHASMRRPLFMVRLTRRWFTATRTARTQPLYDTHPHLFGSPDELTPGISAEEYHERRAQLMNMLPGSKATVVIKGNSLTYATQNIFNPFQQNTNFLYLTGLDEPDGILVLEKRPSSLKNYFMHLFLPLQVAGDDRWTGARPDAAMARRVWGADAAWPRAAFDTYAVREPVPAARVTACVHTLRAHKSPAELSVMRHAVKITHAAFAACMRTQAADEPGLAATLAYHAALRGAPRLAYVPVVAAGARARILHYTANNQRCGTDDLVLIDAGCQYGHYASDISRTFPVSGRFTPAQRELYNAVLNTQKAVVRHLSPRVSLDQLHVLSEEYLTEELCRIGFRTTREEVAHHLYFHHVGHFLGLDVHDTPTCDRAARLRPGQVVTIEPGVYVPPHTFPARFHNLGIRIEDNYVVTADGAEPLDDSAPKTVDAIEACMAHRVSTRDV